MTEPDLRAFERQALLSGGRSVHLATARPGDEAAIAAFYQRLDDTSAYYRFFGLRPQFPAARIHRLTSAPASRHVAMLATIDGDVVGIGELHMDPDAPSAEVAVAVVREHQHEGVATLLLEDLAVIAARLGHTRLTAVTLPGNEAMHEVLRTLGLAEEHHVAHGEVLYSMDLTTIDGMQAAAARRAAAARSAVHKV